MRKEGCEYQTNRPSRELFIYGPLKSLESKTSETENCCSILSNNRVSATILARKKKRNWHLVCLIEYPVVEKSENIHK